MSHHSRRVLTLPLLLAMVAEMMTVAFAAMPPTLSGRTYHILSDWGNNKAADSYPYDSNLGSETPLSQICSSTSPYSIVNIDAINAHFGFNRLPGMQFGNGVCNTPLTSGATYPYLLSCPDIGTAITACQSSGRTMMLTIECDQPNTCLTSDEDAMQSANDIWNLFFSTTYDGARPFGKAVLDGVALHPLGGTNLNGTGVFLSTLKSLAANVSTNPTNRKFYTAVHLSGCQYPDAISGPNIYGPDSNLIHAPLSDPYVSSVDYISMQYIGDNNCQWNTNALQYRNNYFTIEDQWNTFAAEKNLGLTVGLPVVQILGTAYDYIPPLDLLSLNGTSSDGALAQFSSRSHFAGVRLFDSSWDRIAGQTQALCSGTTTSVSYSAIVDSILNANIATNFSSLYGGDFTQVTCQSLVKLISSGSNTPSASTGPNISPSPSSTTQPPSSYYCLAIKCSIPQCAPSICQNQNNGTSTHSGALSSMQRPSSVLLVLCTILTAALAGYLF